MELAYIAAIVVLLLVILFDKIRYKKMMIELKLMHKAFFVSQSALRIAVETLTAEQNKEVLSKLETHLHSFFEKESNVNGLKKSSEA